MEQLNATLTAQGAHGCFAVRRIPDPLLYAARLKAYAADSVQRRRLLLYTAVGRIQVRWREKRRENTGLL